jgi:hypothetical protein
MRAVRLFLLVIFILSVGVILTFFLRARRVVAYGPAVALCPGPDLYGYTCAAGAGYAYISATIDSGLYVDDGLVTLSLPFPFTFYGTTYTRVNASANGNLQFTTRNGAYLNSCLDDDPDSAMGDMIAPYWDDLDLTFRGYLKYDTVGEAPNRIFVVEWQNVPRYGAPTDAVTFAVQLFEGSHDILFFYQDVNTAAGHSGSSATIGLQSATQGLALQYGCNRPVVANASALHFVHPPAPNSRVGLPNLAPLHFDAAATQENGPVVKGEAAELLNALNAAGVTAIPRLQRAWLGLAQPRQSRWQWADVTGDGRDELIVFLRPTRPYPELNQLLILNEAGPNQWRLLYAASPVKRQSPPADLDLHSVADLTGDNRADVLLHDAAGRLLVATAASGDIALVMVPDTCHGRLALRDLTGDGRLEIVRDGCAQAGRVVYGWNGREFTSLALPKP